MPKLNHFVIHKGDSFFESEACLLHYRFAVTADYRYSQFNYLIKSE